MSYDFRRLSSIQQHGRGQEEKRKERSEGELARWAMRSLDSIGEDQFTTSLSALDNSVKGSPAFVFHSPQPSTSMDFSSPVPSTPGAHPTLPSIGENSGVMTRQQRKARQIQVSIPCISIGRPSGRKTVGVVDRIVTCFSSCSPTFSSSASIPTVFRRVPIPLYRSPSSSEISRHR